MIRAQTLLAALAGAVLMSVPGQQAQAMTTGHASGVTSTHQAQAPSSIESSAGTGVSPVSAAKTTTVRGVLERLIEDFPDHTSRTVFAVNHEHGRLTVPARLVGGIAPGTSVVAAVAPPTARPGASQAFLADQPGTVVGLRVAAGSTTAAAQADPLGAHKLLIVPVYWSDSLPADQKSKADLEALGARVDQFYQGTTDGAASASVEQVLDWTKISIVTPTNCDQVRDRVQAAVRTIANGVPTSGDRHVAAYFPRSSLCGWAGLATTPGDFIWVNGYYLTNVVAHELGHNLGLLHSGSANCKGPSAGSTVPLSASCAFVEYGDPYDVMGNYETLSLMSAQRQVNLGRFGDSVVDQIANGVVSLKPLSASSGTRMVRVKSGTKTFTLEYRTATGLDSWLGGDSGQSFEGRNYESPGTGVIVRYSTTAAGPNAQQYLLNFASLHPQTSRLKGMQAGESWIAPDKTLGIKVVSANGDGAEVQVDVKPDLIPPTAFTLTSPKANQLFGGDNATISWSTLTDAASGIGTVDIEVDRTVRKTLTAGVDDLTAAQTVAVGAGAHKVKVTVKDKMGNARSVGPMAFSMSDDVTGPVVGNLTSPAAGSFTKLSVPLVWGKDAIKDAGVGLASMAILVDGNTVRTWNTTNAGVGTTVAVKAGAHTVQVKAVDKAGNVTLGEEVSFTASADATAPVVNLTSPAKNTMLGTGPVQLTWGEITDVGTSTVAASGVKSLDVFVDTTLKHTFLANSMPTGAQVEIPEGAHTIKLVAKDQMGNARTVTTPVKVDITAPAFTDTCPTCKISLVTGVATDAGVPGTAGWMVADKASGIGSLALLADGSPATSLPLLATARTAVVPIKAGDVTWTVKATDKAGNVAVKSLTTSTDIGGLGTAEGWRESTCATCVGGKEWTNTTKGGAFTTTITARNLGLIASTGPDRGKLQVWVDGTLKTTLSLTSATVVDNKQLWVLPVTAGSHTVKLVNVGDAKLPKVGVTGLVSLS